MLKPIDIIDECADEIAAAYKTYEAISEELAGRFLTAIDKSLETLISNPEIGSMSHRGTRKIVLARFPYIIYYTERPLGTQLLAFVHAKRDAISIKSVLSEREQTGRI
jgi:toxin ParE1/3/4